MVFVQSHLAVFAGLGIAVIDLLVDLIHPNAAVTGVINWVLPFLRKAAGQV